MSVKKYISFEYETLKTISLSLCVCVCVCVCVYLCVFMYLCVCIYIVDMNTRIAYNNYKVCLSTGSGTHTEN